MLKKITDFFEKHLLLPEEDDGQNKDHCLRLATAALLIEMTRADYEVKAVEQEQLISVLQQRFSISADETIELMSLAELEADQATSYHEFTSLMNQHYSQQDKVRVIEMLWEVAYADGEIEKYEDFLVRKIADLLYISHNDFIEAKHRVVDR